MAQSVRDHCAKNATFMERNSRLVHFLRDTLHYAYLRNVHVIEAVLKMHSTSILLLIADC